MFTVEEAVDVLSVIGAVNERLRVLLTSNASVGPNNSKESRRAGYSRARVRQCPIKMICAQHNAETFVSSRIRFCMERL